MQYEANGFKVTFSIPKRYNNGEAIEASKWSKFTTELRELQSGLTKILAEGEWESRKDSESVVYIISVRAVAEVDALYELVRRWRKPFGQKKMYFDCHPVYFDLIGD
jgi:hypothetical protein